MSLRTMSARANECVLHTAGAFRLLHKTLMPGRVSILTYHSLIGSPLPVPDWCLLPIDRFEEQMEYLARHFDVLHVEDALSPGRRPSDRPVACVTFDDGFASNYHLALPVLERLGIPATVYLVTDLLGTDDTVWFARLHQAICETRAVRIQFDGRTFPLRGRAARTAASAGLQVALKRLDRATFPEAFDDVLHQLGCGGPRRARPWDVFRMLTPDEVRHMSRYDLVRFGAHTASHQILTLTTPGDARREIERSVAAVAALVARPSRSFAYPNGAPDDFDGTIAGFLREAGIDWAVTTVDGPAGPDSEPYAVRRYGIGAFDTLPRFACLVHHARAAARELTRRLRRKADAPPLTVRLARGPDGDDRLRGPSLVRQLGSRDAR